jgi:NTP pyrophosphatase (non-canonical NTP hydrolase)
MKKPITLSDLQAFIKELDYKPKQKHRYVLKLMEEVGELADVIRRDQRFTKKSDSIKGTIEEELYDVLYYLAALANIYEIELEDCVINKETYNGNLPVKKKKKKK